MTTTSGPLLPRRLSILAWVHALLLASVALNCGSSAPGGGQGGAGGHIATPSSWPGPVTMPVRPLSEGILEASDDVNSPPYPAKIVETSPTTIVWERPIALAVGPGYPSTYTATIAGYLLVECGLSGPRDYTGTFTLREVAGGTTAIAGTVMNDARVVVRVDDEAEVTLVVKGEVDVTSASGCPTAGLHPFELRLAVRAFRPVGAAFAVPPACTSAGVKRVAPGRQMKDNDWYPSSPRLRAQFFATPLNAAGQPIIVANADPRAQVSIRIDGPPSADGSPGTPPFAIDTLWFPDVPGPVTFTPEAGGAPFGVEVAAPEQVDRIDLEIQLAGGAGTPANLMDQTAYGSNNWHRKANRIEPRVNGTYVGADPLCSAPSYAWFTFLGTANVCPAMPAEPAPMGTAVFDGVSIGQASRFAADGTCTLTLQAPQLLGGAGYTKSLTFTVSDVASFLP